MMMNILNKITIFLQQFIYKLKRVLNVNVIL